MRKRPSSIGQPCHEVAVSRSMCACVKNRTSGPFFPNQGGNRKGRKPALLSAVLRSAPRITSTSYSLLRSRALGVGSPSVVVPVHVDAWVSQPLRGSAGWESSGAGKQRVSSLLRGRIFGQGDGSTWWRGCEFAGEVGGMKRCMLRRGRGIPGMGNGSYESSTRSYCWMTE